MSSDLAGPVVPQQLNFSSALPIAIKSTSNRRFHYPTNGQTFSPTGTNQIRININGDCLADFTHSYLQATLKNTGGSGANTLGLDIGVPWISRLEISSQGVILEDIQEYNRLYTMLMSDQASVLNNNEYGLTQHHRLPEGAASALTFALTDAGAKGAWHTAVGNAAQAHAGGTNQASVGAATHTQINTALNNAEIKGAINTAINGAVDGANINMQLHNKDSQLAHNTGKAVYTIPLVSALFNLEKYFPLILTKSGIDLTIHLAPHLEVGVWSGTGGEYQIEEAKFCVHEVQIDPMFYDRLRASMASSGGVLTMAGTTYRHFMNTIAKNASENQNVNISVRVKSLKALFSKFSYSESPGKHDEYCQSVGLPLGIEQYNYRIGSLLYPQTSVKVAEENLGELLQELRKCFGTIGDYSHGTMLNKDTLGYEASFKLTPGQTDKVKSGTKQRLFHIGYNFEGFSATATESGINTADRALPVTLQVDVGSDALALDVRCDSFAMVDQMIYVGLDGSIQVDN